MLVREAIDQARDCHPAFDKQSTPDQAARRFVARYQQGLLTEIAQWKPDALHVDQTITLPLDDFAAGEAIDAHLVLHGGRAVFTDAERPPAELRIVDYPLRLARYEWPAAYKRGTSSEAVLFLLGEVEDWADVASIVLDLFPVGPDAVAMTDALLLPGSPGRACVAALAEFMAGRVTGVSLANRQDLAGAGASYLDEVTGRRRAKVSQTREVW